MMKIKNKAYIESNFQNNISFYDSARDAWDTVLKALPENAKVLLPGYIGITDREGSGIFDPIENNNIQHDFYLLNNDLSISFNELKYKIENGNYQLILLVHYFGFIIPNLSEIISLCKSKGLVIVEDCAHLYNYNLPQFRYFNQDIDFSFYSLHKYFPMDKGGMLWNHDLDNLQVIPSTTNSRYAETIVKYDTSAIADKRRANFMIYDRLIAEIEGVERLKSLSEHDIPHNYPIIVKNGLREKLYFWMIEQRIYVIALYYRLIEPLQITQYANAQKISNDILNLPLYQDLSEEDIVTVLNLLKEGLKEVSK